MTEGWRADSHAATPHVLGARPASRPSSLMLILTIFSCRHQHEAILTSPDHSQKGLGMLLTICLSFFFFFLDFKKKIEV